MSHADRLRIRPDRGLRRLALLAVVGIAWLQLAVAAHAFEHVGAGAADVCDVCAQLDRSGDAPLPDTAGGSAPAAPRSEAVPAVLALVAIRRADVRQRAPPAA